MIESLSGTMYESFPNAGHDYHGYVRVGGVTYKFVARPREDGGSGWNLRLAPVEAAPEQPRTDARGVVRRKRQA